MVLDDVVAYRNEFEQFWWRGPRWLVKDIPDPRDDNESRAAVLAAITHLLCRAFNHRIKLGLLRDMPPTMSGADFERGMTMPDGDKVYESPPQWALSVSALSAPLVLPSFRVIRSPQNECEEFKRYNIIGRSPSVIFI